MTTATPFLENLALAFKDTQKRDFGNQLIVFPNRRAGVFFKQALSDLLDGPIWAPRIQSISDFVASSVPLVIPGKISLLLELFKAYESLGMAESFDHFYSWGEVLLRDFDEIDKYLVSGEQLFREILDIKTIEAAFGPEIPQAEALARFWQNIHEGGGSDSQVGEAFLKIWRTNRAVYQQFREQLYAKGWAYEGMAYRLLAEKPEEGCYSSWDHVTFAGFNALSPSEVSIFKHWQNQASIFWDADPYYLDDPRQEAGEYLRHQFGMAFQRPGPPWITPHLTNSAKAMTAYGVPLNVGQAKILGQLLSEKKATLIPERTAIVLPDEHMLFPTLNALPADITDVNVTMGYPLRNTPFYSLFQNLIKMQREASGGSAEKHFYYREVLRLLRHPYLYPVAPQAISAAEERIMRGNAIYIPATQLQAINRGAEDLRIFSKLFQSVESVNEAFTYFKDLLLILQEQLEAGGLPQARLEQEFLYHFHVHLKQLTEALQAYDIGLSLDTFWRLFSQVIQQEQLPFNGEPLKGVQVMGLLETRCLDFDHVYILSANEGQMPPQPQQQTFIPFNVRQAFGLPTQQDASTVFAYHFYRLLQRAETVTFLYDTEQASLDKGEQSRFLPQIKLELARQNPQIAFTDEVLNAPLHQVPVQPITVPKSQGVWRTLTAYLGSAEHPPDKALSPSALLSYLACPLQFYFRYIAGLREAEAVQEEVAPDTMGNIFHAAAAKLYDHYCRNQGSQVTKAGLQELYPQVEPMVDQAFEEHFSGNQTGIQGGNQLVRDVMVKQLTAVLDQDAERAPFQLLGLETKRYSATLYFEQYDFRHHVHLGGTIDRIEKDEQGIHILDYKTGNVDAPPRDFSKILADPGKYRSALQLFWYSYLFSESEEAKGETLRAALYPVKTLNNRLLSLKAGQGTLEPEDLQGLEETLTTILQSLFDPQEPFEQTDNQETCRTCPFNAICYRQY